MIAYGDREQVTDAHVVIARLSQQLAALAEGAPVIAPRTSAVAALAIRGGILVQGLLDHDQRERGADELSPVASAGATLCLAAGRAFLDGVLTPLVEAFAALASCAPSGPLRLREPEGYAYYAVYPELYIAAAHGLGLRGADVQVVGIRSIGTSLAGFVAAACGTSRLPVTLRPMGNPFARSLRVGAQLEAALLKHVQRTHYLIVDEGPGLSGSSFLAVADWLRARGACDQQITLLPSHGNEPGGEGDPSLRARFRSTRRAWVGFDQFFSQGRLGRWFADVTGGHEVTVRELSAGRWRALHYPDRAAYPASDVTGERRKYLVQADARAWLMKFVGLGPSTDGVLAVARVLSKARLTPALSHARHGFSLTPWLSNATPLLRATYDRAAFVDHLARYLSFRAKHLSGLDRESGAAPPALLTLLKRNASLLLSGERAEPLSRFDAQLAQLTERHRPIATDNKLDACEWLLQPDGSWLKCDAEGHHAAHDCIGAQDPAWDVAGAVIELDLSEPEREQILRALHDVAGKRIDAAQLPFYELAYAAFRAGRTHYAMLPLAGWADADLARLGVAQARYTAAIAQRIEA